MFATSILISVYNTTVFVFSFLTFLLCIIFMKCDVYYLSCLGWILVHLELFSCLELISRFQIGSLQDVWVFLF